MLSVLSGTMASHYDEVTYITWHDLPIFYEIDNRVNVVCAEIECGSHSSWKRMKWLRRYVKEGKPDALISLSTPFNMIALTALAGLRTKVIVSERNDPVYFRWGKLAKLFRNVLYLKADGILVQTKTSQTHLWHPLICKSTIIPNPIMMDKTTVGSAILSCKKHIIITASRLVPQKRNELIISTFAKFLNGHPDYMLEICGEGFERRRLEGLICNLGVEKSVFLSGTVSDIWDRMKNAEMFVMASEYEGMSNSLLEAMALGLPCISTRVSGATDIIVDGDNGMLVDVNDEKELLNAITKMADDESMRTKLGRNAVNIAGKYNISKVSTSWLEYIDRLIS